MFHDAESTYDRLVRSEKELNQARERRHQQERDEARTQREMLEKGSPSGARRGLVNILNGMAANTPPETPGVEAIERVRDLQRAHDRTVAHHNREHTYFEKAGGLESFDRLHPSSSRSQLARRSNFEIGRDSPGMQERTRFDWSERYDPPQTAPRMESRGRVRGDNANGGHFAAGEPEAIIAAWLLEEARRLIENARSRTVGHGYPK